MRDANKAVQRAAMQQDLPPELFSGFLAITLPGARGGGDHSAASEPR